MSDNNLDGNPTAGTTNSTGTSSDNSIDAKKLQSAIDDLTRRLDEVDTRARTVQGEKDKTLSKTTKEVEELKRQIAEIEKLKKSGLDPDAAIEEFSFREEVRGLKDQLARLNPASAKSAGNGVSGVATEAQRLANELKLDLNDKDIADAVASGNVTTLFKVAMGKQSPSPSSLELPPPSGQTPQKIDVDAKIAQLAEMQKTPSKYRAQIKKITEELDAVKWGGQ